MDKEKIIELVTTYLAQAVEGQTTEHAKFDFKAKWYNLNEPEGINEFLKDTTAIVNTIGPDGFIVIGFDEKGKKFTDSAFSDCGMNDTSQLIGLLTKKVDRFFRIEVYDVKINDHNLSVLHIPPSLDKPHIIRDYQKLGKEKSEHNKIFVRRGTTIGAASKYDIDAMYYDRKNIQPDYEIQLSLHSSVVDFFVFHNEIARLRMALTFENTGRRPVAISEMELKVDIPAYIIKNKKGEAAAIDKKSIFYFTGEGLKRENILIQAGEIITRTTMFDATEKILIPAGHDAAEHAAHLQQQKKYLLDEIGFTLTLSNGYRINSKLVFIKSQSFNRLVIQ